MFIHWASCNGGSPHLQVGQNLIRIAEHSGLQVISNDLNSNGATNLWSKFTLFEGLLYLQIFAENQITVDTLACDEAWPAGIVNFSQKK